MKPGLALVEVTSAMIGACNFGELIDEASKPGPSNRADVRLVMQPGQGRGEPAASLVGGAGPGS
ncbi:MAG: hypothetical protein ACE5GC_05285 [Acidimicrobiia bacterium]